MKFFDRGTFTPGTIFLLVAFIAGLLSSISLPLLRPVDVVRTEFNIPRELQIKGIIEEARVSQWDFFFFLFIRAGTEKGS